MIELNFEGPFSVEDIADQGLFRQAGVYMWAVPLIEGPYRVLYVGETGRSFFERAKEHIIQTLGGNYRICDADELVYGRETIVWDGMWRSGTRDRVSELILNVEFITSAALAYLKIKKLYLAPIDCSREQRRRIEGGLVSALRSHPTAGNLIPNDIRYYRTNRNQALITVSIHCAENIEGLPELLQC